MKLRFSFNAPVVLTFSLLAVSIFIVDKLFLEFFTIRNFSISRNVFGLNPLNYLRLFTHPLGHLTWEHLFGNLTFILLLGPILEEKYGSMRLLLLMIATALLTGVLHILISSVPLLGASGIVFMFIVLVSIVDFQRGSIPISFVLVALIFVGKEVMGIFGNDNVSQLTHIAGGVAGAVFGFRQEDKSKY